MAANVDYEGKGRTLHRKKFHCRADFQSHYLRLLLFVKLGPQLWTQHSKDKRGVWQKGARTVPTFQGLEVHICPGCPTTPAPSTTVRAKIHT
eukprot:4233647-Amphidinium_carterae.1